MSTIRHIAKAWHNQQRIDRRQQAGLKLLSRMLKEKQLESTESNEVIVSPEGIVVPHVEPAPPKHPYHEELLLVPINVTGRGRRRRTNKSEPTTERVVIAYERPKSRSKYEPHFGKKQQAKLSQPNAQIKSAFRRTVSKFSGALKALARDDTAG